MLYAGSIIIPCIRSRRQKAESRALMLYRTRPFLAGESPDVTMYNNTEEEKGPNEVSRGCVFLLVRHSVLLVDAPDTRLPSSVRHLSGAERVYGNRLYLAFDWSLSARCIHGEGALRHRS